MISTLLDISTYLETDDIHMNTYTQNVYTFNLYAWQFDFLHTAIKTPSTKLQILILIFHTK